MKVLWIDPINSDPPFLNTLALALSQIGHEVIVRSNKRDGFDPPSNISWYPFSSAKTFPGSLEGRIGWRLAVAVTYPVDWMRAVRFARSAGVKAILLSTNLVLPKFDSWAMNLIRASGIAPVIIVHKPYRDFFQNPNGTHSLRFATYYRQASRILVMNRYTQQILQKLYGLPEDRFVRFPHPHFSDLLSRTPISVPLLNSLSEWAQSRPVISFFSSYSTEHGLETFLASLPFLERLLPGFRILIVSRILDPAERQGLERKLSGMGFGTRCLCRWTPYSYSELLAYVAVTNVVVVPYKHATQSGVIALANGFGVPVVASTAGGLPEMVVAGETGELVPPEDPPALAAAIARVAAPGSHQNYRKKASEFARASLAPKKAACAVESCLTAAEADGVK